MPAEMTEHRSESSSIDAPPAVPQPTARRIPRSLQPRGEILPRSGAGAVPAADRRSSCRAATGLAGTRESAPAASIRPCVFRRLLVAGRGDAPACARGAADETLGGRERRPHRCRLRHPKLPRCHCHDRRNRRFDLFSTKLRLSSDCLKWASKFGVKFPVARRIFPECVQKFSLRRQFSWKPLNLLTRS